MYPANKKKDSVQSGTGIYYQAIPAVSADGKNIMKLIPVEMVNGQFFQTEISRPRIDSTPERSLTIDPASAPAQMVKRTTLNHFAPQQSCRKQVSHVKALSRPVELDHGYSVNKQSLQQQILNLTAKVPSIAAPATNCDKSIQRPCRLPVTVKSPALPKGHQILIPPNAQVQTFPASELPPVIKKQICNSSDNSSSGSSLQNVVLVSPVTTVIQGATSPNDSDTHSVELFSHTSSNASCASQSKASKPHLKLVPKVSQRPNSPIKWVIEEVGSTDQNLLKSQFEATEIIHVMARRETDDKNHNFAKTLPSISSEVLQSLAESETANKTCDSIKKNISQPTVGKSGERQENALVMCNGKVFLMAKKGSLPFKMGQDDPTALSTKSYTLPTSQKSVKPVKTQTQQGLRIVIPDDSDEIIDLCDDEDVTQPDSSVEEDNVIFVSYIPPKTESTSQTYSTPKTQTAPEKETVQEGTSSSNSSSDENHLDSITHVDDRDECSALRGRQSSQSMLASKVKNASVSGSAVVEDSNVTHQQNISSQQHTGSQADPNMSDSSSGTLSRKEDAHKIEFSPNPPTQWKSSLAPKPCWKADHLLRKKFGITANVNICLQRIDETSTWFGLEWHLQDKSISETSGLDNLYTSCKTRETNFSCVKKVKLQNELQRLPTATHSVSHTDVTIKDKCQSGQSSLCRTLCDGEVFGYVEPIDDDFLSTHEDNISKLQTCVKLNTSTRRLGRTRKRTMCPCCTAGTLDHEADRLALSAEQIRKKEGRTKAPGKD